MLQLDRILNKNTAVLCQNKDEAKAFVEACKAMNSSNTVELSSWDDNADETCFDINNKEYVASFASRGYYLSHGYEVVSFNSLKASEEPRRNDSGQPYGIILEHQGNKYLDIVLGYYDGRSRRFNISVERMLKNFKSDFERKPDKYNDVEKSLIDSLKSFDMDSNAHIDWLLSVFKLQHGNADVLPLTKEVVDELDYVLENEKGGGFLNDETYQAFRQKLIGELADIYDEPIKFLGAIVRTIALSVGAVAKDYKMEKAVA